MTTASQRVAQSVGLSRAEEVMEKRKLIEVALPLEAINRESAREKSIRHGHPSTLHLWWARRPLAAARAVLFAQLVDDPSAQPEEFPTEELQRKERDRLHKLIERLVVWENIRDEKLLAEAHAEILKSTDGNPPPILDPSAVGARSRWRHSGSAWKHTPPTSTRSRCSSQRRSSRSHRSSVTSRPSSQGLRIQRFASGREPKARSRCPGVRSLDASKRPRSGSVICTRRHAADGSRATVIAWIWARTVTCPNPACGIEVPLVRVLVAKQEEGQRGIRRPVVL